MKQETGPGRRPAWFVGATSERAGQDEIAVWQPVVKLRSARGPRAREARRATPPHRARASERRPPVGIAERSEAKPYSP